MTDLRYGFAKNERQGVTFYTIPSFHETGLTRHGFSTRYGGVSKGYFTSMNLAIARGDRCENVLENYRRFCAAVGTSADSTVFTNQVHKDHVREATPEDIGKGLFRERGYEADGLMTDRAGIAMVAHFADCTPVYLLDPVKKAAALVHCGWRGTAALIAFKAVARMCERYGSRASDILAGIGPCIGPCCFETDDDVQRAMVLAMGENADPFMRRQGEKWHVDLAQINAKQLVLAGLLPRNVTLSGLCTCCLHDEFFSHRKTGGNRGAQAALLEIC